MGVEDKPKRAVMNPISEAARRWAHGLRAELEPWPGVEVKLHSG